MMRTVVSAIVVLVTAIVIAPGTRSQATVPTEAPTGFTLESNGFAEEFCANQAALSNSPNSPRIPDDRCNFETAIAAFAGSKTIGDGLGPIFNAASCGECHAAPILGASGQFTEKRAGLFNGLLFIEHPGGSLIQDRATNPRLQELPIPIHTNVVALRSVTTAQGAGFVEAIANTTLEAIAQNQPVAQRGLVVDVPLLEQPGANRVGRFGWKNQHASLVSYAADSYKNELGITNPLEPVESTSNGNLVGRFDPVPDPEDDGVTVELLALFMRSLKAPPVDSARVTQEDARAGRTIFNNIGCGICHTSTVVTAPPGTLINGGTLRVADALGNKIIHPFSDFLLHNIGTGDGIVQNGDQSTRNRVRTAPLWGLRSRGRFMHDGLTFTFVNAIQRHAGQAASARNQFNALSASDRDRLIVFLFSL